MKVALFPGHTIYSNEAAAGGLREHPLCRMVVDRVKAECRRQHMAHALDIVDPYPDLDPQYYVEDDPKQTGINSLNGRIYCCNNQPDLDACVSVHLNAHEDPNVDYPLIVAQEGSAQSYELGAAIGGSWRRQNFIMEDIRLFTPRRLDRRIGLIERVRVPTVILEPMFLTNPRVRSVIMNDVDWWVAHYAEGILTGLNQMVSE